MKNYVITFGQIHVHSVEGKTYDKDCVALIYAESQGTAHAYAIEVFDSKFHRCYSEETYDTKGHSEYYPRGKIVLVPEPT